jgi:hypothetical protein
MLRRFGLLGCVESQSSMSVRLIGPCNDQFMLLRGWIDFIDGNADLEGGAGGATNAGTFAAGLSHSSISSSSPHTPSSLPSDVSATAQHTGISSAPVSTSSPPLSPSIVPSRSTLQSLSAFTFLPILPSRDASPAMARSSSHNTSPTIPSSVSTAVGVSGPPAVTRQTEQYTLYHINTESNLWYYYYMLSDATFLMHYLLKCREGEYRLIQQQRNCVNLTPGVSSPHRVEGEGEGDADISMNSSSDTTTIWQKGDTVTIRFDLKCQLAPI